MSFNLPLISGHTGFGGAIALDLIARHDDQVQEVARFRPVVRHYRAPGMQQAAGASAAVPLKDMRPGGVDLLA
jgi:hypothetical protein